MSLAEQFKKLANERQAAQRARRQQYEKDLEFFRRLELIVSRVLKAYTKAMKYTLSAWNDGSESLGWISKRYRIGKDPDARYFIVLRVEGGIGRVYREDCQYLFRVDLTPSIRLEELDTLEERLVRALGGQR